LALDKEMITIDEATEHLEEIRSLIGDEHEVEVATKIWSSSRDEPNWKFAEKKDDIMWNYDPFAVDGDYD